MNNDFKRMGENIKQYRVERELSQMDLARILKVDKAYISRIENGKKNITLNSIMKIAVALNVNVGKLFE